MPSSAAAPDAAFSRRARAYSERTVRAAEVEQERRRRARRAIGGLWAPTAQAQHELRASPADEVYFGGKAGGGKTDALLGEAITNHHDSLILRRLFTDLTAIEDRAQEIIGRWGTFNGNKHRWRLRDGRTIEFGACQLEKHKLKWQGRPHDLKGFDELPQFSLAQYQFIIGWNRSTVPGQRCRVIGAGNPPTTPEGRWVIKHWAPWLDPDHARPAAHGELRWFAMLDGKDVEVDGPAPFTHHGETIEPKSRTFIPANLADNPYLANTGYRATLQRLPEPLRSQLLLGDFRAGMEDDAWQVIPTAWAKAAQQRWTEAVPRDGQGKPLPMTAIGVDVARGGQDQTALARRHGHWFAPVDRYPGASTPDGPAVAGLVLAAMRDGAKLVVDSIGVGASVYDHLRQRTPHAVSFVASQRAPGRDRSGVLEFANLRAYAYWALRDALDPTSGVGLALPPDPELLADLTAPRWSLRATGVTIESKDDIRERLGRSTDTGDAIVQAWVGPEVGAVTEIEAPW